MCDNNSNECRCISEILNVINILQENAECTDSCLDTCDRGFLGGTVETTNLNTRPIMLYTSSGNGTPWSMPISRETVTCDETSGTCSNVFRVEKIDGCCATFRVLETNPNATEATTIPYITTNSFFTMNLNCVCCIRCLQDTFVEGV